MSSPLRSRVASELRHIFKQSVNTTEKGFESLLGVSAVNKTSDPLKGQIYIPASFCVEQPDVPGGGVVRSVSVERGFVNVNIDRLFFAKNVLQRVYEQNESYGFTEPVHKFITTDFELKPVASNQNVVVEFSSPNIAKPFHAGHLRSTIIGNFVANINQSLGHRVVRLNYLGDWGTQFGLLGVGYQKYGADVSIPSMTIDHLFDVYVRINKDLTTDGSIHAQSMDYFKKLESGDPEMTELWKLFRDCSIRDYKDMYERLGVHFDEYHFESMYFDGAKRIATQLRSDGILELDKDSGRGYVDLISDKGKQFRVNIIKSDGTTLYLTRDLAAIIDRHQQYNFDRIHYVVEQGQEFHFKSLVGLLSRMDLHLVEGNLDNIHITFGRVAGMSTRKGEVVFLKNILDEAKSRMLERLDETYTTKVSRDCFDRIADVLGVTCIIVRDLKDKRTKGYKFDWNAVLTMKGDSGVSLQYAHSRLHSIEETSHVTLNPNCDFEILNEPEATRLINHIARFDDVVNAAFVTYEPHVIVQYLFMLVHLINSANKVLKVKGQGHDVAVPRLLLFHCARVTLRNGLKLIGIEPLDKM